MIDSGLPSEPDEEQRPARQPRAAPARRAAARTLLRRGLASPDALRQAFLLHEVLGPPVSLRDDRLGGAHR